MIPSVISFFMYENGSELNYEVLCDKDTYDILMLRYNEIPRITVPGFDKPPFDINSYLTETSVQIDYDWINSRFRKYMKAIESIIKKGKKYI